MFPKLLQIFVLIIFFFGCTDGKYPDEWSTPRANFFSLFINEGCPNVQGTWDIRKEKHIWPLFGIIEEDSARLALFETLTITGDSRTELTLSLERSFSSVLEQVTNQRKEQIEKNRNFESIQKRYLERLDPKVRMLPPYDTYTDDEYTEDLKSKFGFYENLILTAKAKRGREYTCEAGWLRELYSNNTKTYGDTTHSISLNKAGDLIRKSEHTYKSYFSFWCGDHCDNSIRLPDVHKEWWDRRVTTKPISNPTPSWKVSFKPVAKPVIKPPNPLKQLTKEEVLTIVPLHLPSGVILKNMISNGGTWMLEIYSIQKIGISVLLKSLSNNKKLSQPELIEVVEKQNGWIAQIYIKASQ